MTTTTQRYTRTHNAIAVGASRAGIRVHAARVLIALADRGGEASSRDLFADTATVGARERDRPESDGASVRRAISMLVEHGLVSVEAPGVPARMRGESMRVTLTDAGRAIAGGILQAAKGRGK